MSLHGDDRVVRVGLLGCGERGLLQAQAWQALPDGTVVAICDPNEARRKRVGDSIGVAEPRRYSTGEEMLSGELLDVVVVATRTNQHAESMLPILRAGIHAVGEKPLDDELSGAKSMLDAATAHGVRVAVHHQDRVMPCERELQRRIAMGDIGRVVELRGAAKGYYGGYDLLNQGTHLLNSFRGLARSEFEWVHATLQTGDRPTLPEDIVVGPHDFGVIAGEHVVAEIGFRNGVRGVLLEHRHEPVHRSNAFLHVRGTEGQFWVGSDAWTYWFSRDTWLGPNVSWEEIQVPLASNAPAGVDLQHPGLLHGEIHMAREMIDALKEGRPHVCSLEEAYRIMHAMMGCYVSHFEQRRVTLPLSEFGHPLLRIRAEAGLGPVDASVPVAYEAWLPHELTRIERGGARSCPLKGPAGHIAKW